MIGDEKGCVVLSVGFSIILVACFVIWKKRYSQYNRNIDKEDNIRFYSSSILTLGLVLYPLIFNLTVGTKLFKSKPAIIFGLIWPMIIMLAYLKSDQVEMDTGGTEPLPVSSYKDTGILLTTVLSLGAILISMPEGAGGERKMIIQLLMYAAMLGMAFVLPIGNLTGEQTEGSNAAVIAQTSQRVFMAYAIGFIIVSLIIFITSAKK